MCTVEQLGCLTVEGRSPMYILTETFLFCLRIKLFKYMHTSCVDEVDELTLVVEVLKGCFVKFIFLVDRLFSYLTV